MTSDGAGTSGGAARGRFVVLDGVDGCGKSTQAARLARRLAAATGREVRHLREPGSTALGEGLRALLLSREHALDSDAEALLFAAARRQMLVELVEPALARGEHVVCERFHPSTYAYQGVAGGSGAERVLALLRAWAGAPAPDLELILDLPPRLAAARRGAASDRIEDKGEAFLARVVDGYRAYARASGATVVDAGAGADEVADAIWRAVAPLAEVRA